MTVVKDWMLDAAIEIYAICLESIPSQEQIRDVLIDHCPFKPDVTYMEVEPDVAYEKVKPSPLLICIDCKNTESPAGAMARYFNQGRCLHCGGYFKVFRA